MRSMLGLLMFMNAIPRISSSNLFVDRAFVWLMSHVSSQTFISFEGCHVKRCILLCGRLWKPHYPKLETYNEFPSIIKFQTYDSTHIVHIVYLSSSNPFFEKGPTNGQVFTYLLGASSGNHIKVPPEEVFAHFTPIWRIWTPRYSSCADMAIVSNEVHDPKMAKHIWTELRQCGWSFLNFLQHLICILSDYLERAAYPKLSHECDNEGVVEGADLTPQETTWRPIRMYAP